MATCIVYVCLTVVLNEHVLAYSLSYVIVLRLWRLGRLYHRAYALHTRKVLQFFERKNMHILCGIATAFTVL